MASISEGITKRREEKKPITKYVLKIAALMRMHKCDGYFTSCCFNWCAVLCFTFFNRLYWVELVTVGIRCVAEKKCVAHVRAYTFRAIQHSAFQNMCVANAFYLFVSGIGELWTTHHLIEARTFRSFHTESVQKDAKAARRTNMRKILKMIIMHLLTNAVVEIHQPKILSLSLPAFIFLYMSTDTRFNIICYKEPVHLYMLAQCVQFWNQTIKTYHFRYVIDHTRAKILQKENKI